MKITCLTHAALERCVYKLLNIRSTDFSLHRRLFYLLMCWKRKTTPSSFFTTEIRPSYQFNPFGSHPKPSLWSITLFSEGGVFVVYLPLSSVDFHPPCIYGEPASLQARSIIDQISIGSGQNFHSQPGWCSIPASMPWIFDGHYKKCPWSLVFFPPQPCQKLEWEHNNPSEPCILQSRTCEMPRNVWCMYFSFRSGGLIHQLRCK